jgi:hemolysin III
MRLKDPFSGLSHLGGALLSIAGLVLLVVLARGKPWHVTSFSIYGATLILLYTASALYHLLPVGGVHEERLFAFDQVAIFALIAGTYTPVCLVPLRGPWGWSLLGVVWGLGLAGIATRLGWRKAPQWLYLGLYVVMGWLCLVALAPLVRALPGPGLAWLAAGGVLYTVGAVVFATQRPRLWPGKFGSHDLWHVFVLAGSACHFVVMLCFVAPRP